MPFDVSIDGNRSKATWTDDNPRTRQALEDALPVEGTATRWGCELYFDLALDVGLENAVEEVSEGAVAYWPGGDAVCLFWGTTPASLDEEPRAAAPVNVVAHVEDTEVFDAAPDGTRVSLDP